MAKGGGKLTKLKSVLKKWNSFSKIHGSRINGNTAANHAADEEDDHGYSSTAAASAAVHDSGGRDCHPVYVGKSRRRYLISSDVMEHPLFQELVERSGDGESITVVGCEVVLFEHLLWMLENADPQPESMDDLLDFYVC